MDADRAHGASPAGEKNEQVQHLRWRKAIHYLPQECNLLH
jgi:hypothetical protein